MSIKSKIIGVTSDILSAPAKIKALRSKQQADSDVKSIKLARAYKGAPDEVNGGEAGMARSLAQDVKDRLTKRK